MKLSTHLNTANTYVGVREYPKLWDICSRRMVAGGRAGWEAAGPPKGLEYKRAAPAKKRTATEYSMPLRGPRMEPLS